MNNYGTITEQLRNNYGTITELSGVPFLTKINILRKC